jgi:hypothetical protein
MERESLVERQGLFRWEKRCRAVVEWVVVWAMAGALVARIDGEEEDVLVVSTVCHYRDTLADLDTKQTENSKSVLVELSTYM